MDCPCMLQCKFSSNSKTTSSADISGCPLVNNTPFKFLSISQPHRRNLGLFSANPAKTSSLKMRVSAVSSVETREEEDLKNEKKKRRHPKSSGGDRVKLKVRLDHQVVFGEHVGILGSAKEFGSWKNKVMMDWTENGWVCELELGSTVKPVEFKFVIEGSDKKLVWEGVSKC